MSFLFCGLSVQYFTPNPLELLVSSLPISRNSGVFLFLFFLLLCCCWVCLFVRLFQVGRLDQSVIEVAYIFPSVSFVIAYGFWLCRSFWVLLKFIQFFLKNVFFSGFWILCWKLKSLLQGYTGILPCVLLVLYCFAVCVFTLDTFGV